MLAKAYKVLGVLNFAATLWLLYVTRYSDATVAKIFFLLLTGIEAFHLKVLFMSRDKISKMVLVSLVTFFCINLITVGLFVWINYYQEKIYLWDGGPPWTGELRND